MKKILIAFAIILVQNTQAQSVIIDKVKIEFDRQINVWASYPPGEFADRMKKNTPQYTSNLFTFESDGKKSLYSPIPAKETATGNGFFMSGVGSANDNIVYSNFENGTSISLKNIFEKTYLIEDSLRNAKWKITNDFREIAGFNCRRATTTIMDSVFVVAFYSDEIMIPGGPESFNGLPGMIMGLVINRLHTTWYATKVSVTNVNQLTIVPPVKAKAVKTTMKKLTDLLRSTFSNWGSNTDKSIWAVSI
ncbi:MAG: GLPGLI family protein [Ginsengibacter sp.]